MYYAEGYNVSKNMLLGILQQYAQAYCFFMRELYLSAKRERITQEGGAADE